MAEYTTYYVVFEDIKEIEPIHFTWKVGECTDGSVYLCLDETEDAIKSVSKCQHYYESLDKLFKAYPYLNGKVKTDKVDEDGKIIEEYIIDRRSVC